MKIPGSEEFDLIITQSIERYLEMPSHEARETIKREWREQIATLLTAFLSMLSRRRGSPYGFMYKSRSKGDSQYIVPFRDGEAF